MADILNCPFCGEEPVFPSAEDTYGTCYEGGCDSCGIATVSTQIVDCFDQQRQALRASWDDEKHRYGIEYIEVARNKALELWNTRKK